MLLFFGMNHNVQDQKHLHQAAGCLGTQKKKKYTNQQLFNKNATPNWPFVMM